MRICYIKASHSLLEPYEGKLSCTVLRGESPREVADLLDPIFDFCIDSTLNKPLYVIFLLVYGGKVKYKSLHNNTLK